MRFRIQARISDRARARTARPRRVPSRATSPDRTLRACHANRPSGGSTRPRLRSAIRLRARAACGRHGCVPLDAVSPPHLQGATAAAGLARSRDVEQQGRPDKVVYAITPSGRRALRAWLDEVEDDPSGGRVVFPLKLFFCEFGSRGTARAHLDAYRSFCERLLARYEDLSDRKPELGAFAGHVLEHGLTRLSATIEWIDTTAVAIEREKRVDARARA